MLCLKHKIPDRPIAFGVATLLAILFYVAPYALPASGLVHE